MPPSTIPVDRGGGDAGQRLRAHPDRGRQGGDRRTRAVSGLDGVVAAEGVTGPYDVIVRAEAGTVDELGQMVVGRIQLIDGITRTVTCPVVNL